MVCQVLWCSVARCCIEVCCCCVGLCCVELCRGCDVLNRLMSSFVLGARCVELACALLVVV